MTAPAVSDREQWLAWRTRGIGASEIAGILRISPWQTPYSIWQAKVGGGSSGTGPSPEAMHWGKLLEDAILDECEHRLAVTIAARQVPVTHPDHPWAIATLDGIWTDTQLGQGVVEAKTTGTPRWDDVPDYYQAQVQWQLEVTGMDQGWVACLHQGRHLTLWPITRDPEIGEGLVAVAGDFWQRHVLGGEPPAVDAAPATSEAIARRFAVADPAMVADLTEIRGEILQLQDVNEIIKGLDDAKNLCQNRIREALGNATEGQIDGQTVVTWRKQVQHRIDTAALRERYPDVAREVETENPVRVLRLTGKPVDNLGTEKTA
jgi:putative phage-type endonuclease